MAPRLKRLSGREILRILKRFGFELVATRGSHAKLRRITGEGYRETLTLPLHKELDTGTIHAMWRQAARYIPEAQLRRHFWSD